MLDGHRQDGVAAVVDVLSWEMRKRNSKCMKRDAGIKLTPTSNTFMTCWGNTPVFPPDLNNSRNYRSVSICSQQVAEMETGYLLDSPFQGRMHRIEEILQTWSQRCFSGSITCQEKISDKVWSLLSTLKSFKSPISRLPFIAADHGLYLWRVCSHFTKKTNVFTAEKRNPGQLTVGGSQIVTRWTGISSHKLSSQTTQFERTNVCNDDDAMMVFS